MADRLTDEQIAALEAMEKAATQGEWNSGPETGAGHVWIYVGGEPLVEPTHFRLKAFSMRRSPRIKEYKWVGGVYGRAASEDDFWKQKVADAELIVAARNALPSLLAEVRALREAGEALGHALCGIYARAVAARTDAAIVTNQVMGVEHVAAAVATLADEHKALRAEVAALRECLGGMEGQLSEAEEVLAPFMLMCSAWDGQPAETVVAEVGVQSIRVSAFREARDFWLGRIKSELDRAALAGVRALREGEPRDAR